MSLYVADTHALVWYLTDDRQLSKRAGAFFEAADGGQAHIYVSTMVLAEIMYLSEKRRTTVRYDETVRHLSQNPNYTIVDVTLEVLESAKQLHGAAEIFDRLIAATAVIYNAKLITRDTTLSSLEGVECVW